MAHKVFNLRIMKIIKIFRHIYCHTMNITIIVFSIKLTVRKVCIIGKILSKFLKYCILLLYLFVQIITKNQGKHANNNYYSKKNSGFLILQRTFPLSLFTRFNNYTIP